MWGVNMRDLSERSRRVLHAVVVEFIEHGEPVGSRMLTEKHFRDLSPATIRNVLAELEEAGFLYQPHTSAGRIPTELGFRLFVDGLMLLSSLSGQEEAEIQSLDELSPGPNLLQESGRVLSELAGVASLIMASHGDKRLLSEIRFICAHSSKALLAVLMFRDGSVETRFVDCDTFPTDGELERVHNLLSEVVHGRTLGQVRDIFAHKLESERVEIDAISRRAFELAMKAADNVVQEPIVVIQGQDRLMDSPDFRDVDRLRQLVRALQEKKEMLTLLDRTIGARTVQVLVGREAGELSQGALSFVLAPFTEAGQPLGMVGVLGPTRMNYPKMVPLVSATADAVSAAHDRAVNIEPRKLVRRRRPGRPT
jgi:heat-inducible transcriptional repressor